MIVQNPRYAGWARTRGYFKPRIEIGVLGSMLDLPYLNALLCHEYVHLRWRHNLKLLTWSLAWFAVTFVACARLLPPGLGLESLLALSMLAAVTAASIAGTWLLRRFERAADAHAAFTQGRVWHKLLKELMYLRPTPADLIVYGTREARLARVLEVAKQSPNYGYPEGGELSRFGAST